MISYYTYLVHFGFEINKAKSMGLSFGYLCHEDGSIWFSETDDFGYDLLVDIEQASEFGFFTSALVDTAIKLWRDFPTDHKILYMDPAIFMNIRTKENIDRDLISQVLYRGLPRPITIYTPDNKTANLALADIKIKTEDIPLVDAFLAVFRMGPQTISASYPDGIPCNMRNDNELP